MKCKPCRVTFEGVRYFVASDGQVYLTWQNVATVPGGKDTWSLGEPLAESNAKLVRAEASRQRRNRNNRERSQAMRDLGLRRNHNGSWE